MLFKKAESTSDLFERLVLNDSLEIGIHPVLYGFRVRVGETDDLCYQLDLCGGDSVEMIDLLYNGCRKIIEGQLRINGKINLSEFPVQNKKPFFKDMSFLKDFCDLILKYRDNDFDSFEFEITREKLSYARLQMMSTFLNS